MKRIYNAVVYKISKYLFQNWGIPKVINEQISKSFLKQFLPKNPVIIDCGAYDGSDSVELLTILGGVVHSFEAVPLIFERLKEKTKDYENIKVYNLALSNDNTLRDLYVSQGHSDASSSLLKPRDHIEDHPTTFFAEVIKVETITLDNWSKINGVERIDLLWLDMQGFELEMLKSSTKILSNVRVIHTEVSVKETYEGVAKYGELRTWLENAGFHVEIEAIPKGYDMGNVVFVRNQSISN